jgi:hypothetical protein
MGTACHPSADLTRSELIDALLQDPRWLREQFEQIVVAEWGAAPPQAGTRTMTGIIRPWPRARHRAAEGRNRTPRRPRRPGIGGWVRQRSPPAAAGPARPLLKLDGAPSRGAGRRAFPSSDSPTSKVVPARTACRDHPPHQERPL